MALVVKDRVRETSTTTGTGTFTLAGAVAGFQSFSAIGTGNTTYYTIVNGTTQWEVGIGTWTSPNQLTRNVLASSTGSLVNFTAGTKDVFVTFPADGFGKPPAIGDITPNTIAGTTITGNNVISYGRFTVDDIGSSGYTAELGVDANGYAVIGGSASVGGTIDQAILAPAGLALGDSNTAVVTLNAAPTSAYGLNFPPTAGSANQVLATNGSGNLSWATVDPLTLTGISDPTAPTGTNTTVYSKSFGGYATLAARNALNTSFGLQSALWSKNFQIWTTTASAAGLWVNATGTGNGNYTNTNPTAGATKYQSCRRSVYANLITTTNQVLGVANGQGCWFRGSTAGLGGYFYYARVGFDVWTNGGRFFAGMATSTTVVTAGDPSTSNNSVGFCVDAADNGAISFLTRGTTAATKASTGLTISSNKGYDCYIYCSPNSSQYTWQIIDINTGTSASGTATANLPSNTIMLASEALASNAALTTADAIKIGVCKVYIESDN